MSILPWELPEDEYERRYWIDRFHEYIELENDPAVVAYRKKRREKAGKKKGSPDSGRMSAKERAEKRGMRVEDGGKAPSGRE